MGGSEAPTTFKIYAVDPASSQVAFYGVMKEWDKPRIIAMRLKMINGKITEIEQNLVTARPGLLADVNDNDRTPRQVMIDAADSYFEAIEHGKGSIAPFAEDCERHENGGQTAHNETPVPWRWTSAHPKRIRVWR